MIRACLDDRDVIINWSWSLVPPSAVPSMAVLNRPLYFKWSIVHACSVWSWAQPYRGWSSLCMCIRLPTYTVHNLICMDSQPGVQHWTDRFPLKWSRSLYLAITHDRGIFLAIRSQWMADGGKPYTSFAGQLLTVVLEERPHVLVHLFDTSSMLGMGKRSQKI